LPDQGWLGFGTESGPKGFGGLGLWPDPRGFGDDLGSCPNLSELGLLAEPKGVGGWVRGRIQGGWGLGLVQTHVARGLVSVQGKPVQAPRVSTGGVGFAHTQGMSTSVPTLGVRIPGPLAPPKLELTIFSPTILSIPNASQQKDNLTSPTLSLKLSVARASLPLHCSNLQCFVSR